MLEVQEKFIGKEAQEKVNTKTVAIVGCGGLGSPLVQMAARSGIKKLILVDNDIVSHSNLGRQILYTTHDIGKYKAEVAKEIAKKINPHMEVVAYTERLTSDNVDKLLHKAHIILDGTDNYKTRFILSRYAEKTGKDFVFGAVAGAYGMAKAFPHTEGIYLHHVMNPSLETAEAVPTAESGGLVPSILLFITGFMWTEALKMAMERYDLVNDKMLIADLFQGEIKLLG